MPKKKKLQLANLKVTSFVTAEESRQLRGMTAAQTNCKVEECLSLIGHPICNPDPGTGTCNTCNTCVTCVNSCNGTCNGSCPVYLCLPTRDIYCPSDPTQKICMD